MERLNTAVPTPQKFYRRNARTYKKQVQKTAPVKDEQTPTGANTAKIVQTSTHVKIVFPAPPSEAIRSDLKRSYFKFYTRPFPCWQRFKSYTALCVAHEILKKYYAQPA